MRRLGGQVAIFDIETDSLTPTLIHVLSYNDGNTKKSITDYDEMREWVLSQDVLIGHNIISFDIPVLEQLLDIKTEAKIIDTLYLSWYLYPKRNFHGLEQWGDDLGVKKPEVDDWVGADISVYEHRCSSDVEINTRLWSKMCEHLNLIYENEDTINLPIVNYLMFKASCIQDQAVLGIKLDVVHCHQMIDKLSPLIEEKVEALKLVMPPIEIWKPVSYPAKPFKKDGTLSVQGAKWSVLLRENDLPDDHKEDIMVMMGTKEPNPNSPDQKKAWLFSLGWEPETFNEVKEEDGSIRKIPQINLPNGGGLCPSILRLAEENEDVKHLAGLSVLVHRLGIFKGFLAMVGEDGYIVSEIGGLTNTLRVKHRGIANLPKVSVLYGAEIRASFICEEDEIVIGSDMTALEDLTKRHYIYDYDPEYVEEMSIPGYDPHLALAIAAGALTEEQSEAHKAGTEYHNDIRHLYKTTNYSATYGIGATKLARDLKIAVAKAIALLEAYWAKNWAIKAFADSCFVKKVWGQDWVYNPVSGFYYSLRAQKDIFSTVNQSTGVYCFDTWIAYMKQKKLPIPFQYHDEVLVRVKKKNEERARETIQWAMDKTNEKLRLNIELSCGVKSGRNYSDVH